MEYCVACNAELPLQSAYCSKCGALIAGEEALTEQRRLYSLRRVGILSLVSFGLYFPYWMYVSWKQLMTELPEKRFYPSWHAFSQFVPIYNLVVLFQHFHTIQAIQKRNGTLSNISLGLLAFVIIMAFGIVALAYSLRGPFFTSGLWVITYSLAATGIALWGQENLNRYWVRVTATRVRSAATGPGEIIVSVTGAASVSLIVLFTIFVSSFAPAPITSVSDVRFISRVTVGETTPSLGTISDGWDAEGYSFLAREGYRYTIEVGPAHVGEILVDGEILAYAMVTLWDSNGTTVIRTKSATIYYDSVQYPIVLRWTAPSTATRYVTVEPGGIYKGAYFLRVYSSRRETD